MKITVQYGERCEDLLISSDDTVLDMKRQLSGIFDIDVEMVYLRFNNKYLLEKYDMKKYQIKDNSKLIMTATITIMIEYKDEMIPVEVLSDATVTDLRKQISETERMEGLHDCGLMFEGVYLDDHEKICKYNIKDKSMVTIIYKIQLRIESCRKNFEVRVIPNAKIADVKKELSEVIKINTNNINLRFDSIYLLDDKRLTKYKIENNSVVFVRIQMRIFVDYCGESHEIKSSSENTFDNIKTQLSIRTGIGTGFIHLYLNGQEMRNEDLLGQYGIQERLELVMRVRMTVVIQFCDKDYNIEIFSDETILNLKRKLCEGFKKDMSEISLYFNNQIMNDDTMLKDYQIKDNSRLIMKTTIKFLIEFCDKQYIITTYSDATVDDIKRQLEKKYKVGKEEICLWSKERRVDKDDEKIYKYDIQNNSIIKMREKIKIKIIFHIKEYNFALFSDEKVSDLLNRLSKEVKVDQNVILLKLCNLFLQNDEYLYKYGLRDSTLIMITKMRICVTFDRQKYEIENVSNTKVKELKKQLREKCKVKYTYISLKESEREMKDEDELGMYGIGSINVSISIYSFRIVVKCFNKHYLVNVPSHMSVNELKTIVKEKCDFKSTNNFHLIFRGDLLENDKKLECYDLEDKCVVSVMSCLTGG